MTWAAWLKPAALQSNSIVYSRRDATNAFLIGMDKGIPFVEVNGRRSPAGAPVAAASWHQLAVTSAKGKLALYLDGEHYAELDAVLPAMNSPANIGADTTGRNDATGFTGDMDELEISKVTRSADLH